MIQLRLFGAVSINDTEGQDLRSALVQSKRTALLAYLAVARPRTSHRRENLLALFWPELSEERARRALNQAVYYLRNRLGPESIMVRAGDEIGLSREHISCDVVDFEDLLDAGEEKEALAFYQGPLLHGFNLSELLEFERWADSERARLHERAARGAWVLADKAAEAGTAHEAIGWARRSMELSRDESAVRHLIATRDRFGDRAGAIREYDRFARQLARELEADPSPETQDLIAHIRARTGSTTPAMPRAAIPHSADGAEPPEPPVPEVGRLFEPPPESRSETREPPARARRRLAFLLVSLPLAALSAWLVYRELNPPPPAIVPGTVAIMPFAYTGSIDHADAADAIVNLLDANIENAGPVHTVDWRSLKSFVERSTDGPLTLAAAAAAAERFKAEWYIVGSVNEAGDRLRVTAAVYDRNSGDLPGMRVIAEGDPKQLFSLVDELTGKLLAGRSGPSARLYRSAILTTSSINALKAYLEGEQDFRGARYISALQKFRRAVDADSAFALAYFRLSQSADLTGEPALAMWAATEALEQSRGLGRYERQHAEAWRLTLQGQATRAMQIYSDLIAQDTTDIEAMQQLAYLHYSWGPRYGQPASESGREWRRVLNRDPYNPLALVHLARLAARDGNRRDFTWLSERIARFGPESDRALELNALKAYAFADSGARAAVMRDLSTANPAVRQKVIVSLLTSASDLREPASLASRYLAADGVSGERADSYAGLESSISVARGQIREALAATGSRTGDNGVTALERGVILFLNGGALPPDAMKRLRDSLVAPTFPARADARLALMPDYVAGLLDVRLGEPTAANREAARLDTRAQTRGDARRLANLLRAELARAAGDPARALSILGDPVPEGSRVPQGFAFPLAHERFLRAELLRELRRTPESLRWYATFPDPAGYDLWYLGNATLRIAEAYDRIGSRAAAARYYGKAAKLWRDADPALQGAKQAALARAARLTE